MIQTTVKVSGMACSMCEAHINDTIRGAFSVEKVSSSHSKVETVIVSKEPLDENALRNAMALLSSLADGDRMIGVIYHMPELRERIDKKNVVHKKLTGSEIELEY